MMCSAETVISILHIPLQLKLLQPWNRGIHGYIRRHVKGCLSVSLFFSSPHLFPHSSFERNHCATPRFLTIMIWFSKWHLWWIISITLMKIDWLLNICKLWMQTILHLQLPARLWRSEMQILCISVLQRLQTERLYRSIPSTMYLQSSEQPVTLTTQFYHSSPLLPSLTAGIKCALNVYCCRVLHLSSR